MRSLIATSDADFCGSSANDSKAELLNRLQATLLLLWPAADGVDHGIRLQGVVDGLCRLCCDNCDNPKQFS